MRTLTISALAYDREVTPFCGAQPLQAIRLPVWSGKCEWLPPYTARIAFLYLPVGLSRFLGGPGALHFAKLLALS
jgi:hypothetical protein